MLIARTFAGDAKRDTAAQHTTNEALGAMNDPISKDNVLNINGRLAMKPGFDTSGFISTLRARALKRLPALLGEVLGKADDTLFDFVQRADGKLNHQEYFDAMRELRRQRPQIEQRFADHISSTFAAYDQRTPLRVDLEQGAREMAKGELSLVSEERTQSGERRGAGGTAQHAHGFGRDRAPDELDSASAAPPDGGIDRRSGT